MGDLPSFLQLIPLGKEPDVMTKAGPSEYIVHVPEDLDVKAIRSKTEEA